MSKREKGPGLYAASVAWAAFRDQIREGLEKLVESGRNAGHTLGTALEVVVEEVKQGWSNSSPDIIEGCAKLAKEGWFPDDEWPWTIFADLAGTDVTRLEQDFVEHYEERAEDICRSLGQAYPKRRVILEQAFAAHQDRKYALSTPVFIAQAEGITVDILGKQGYQACDAKGGVASYELGRHLDDKSAGDAVLRPFLEAFVSRPPLLANKKDRQANPQTGLNRHLVLHGNDTSYATRANSCKAMSWLYWIHWVLASTPP